MQNNNTATLKALLNEIWKLGDHDEMSIKHIGHGLAALVAFGDWQRAIDYDRPRQNLTKANETKLFAYWEQVKESLEGLSRADSIALFESLDIAWYGAAYLEWSQYETKEGN
jgi:hypothetical protein